MPTARTDAMDGRAGILRERGGGERGAGVGSTGAGAAPAGTCGSGTRARRDALKGEHITGGSMRQYGET
ncbi:hypothetical protein [Streptomyces sp. NPDC056154]|uniref:hypothetical protein n=1 Tax=unclassified Streptomyces TaxID=2593676 RepID=UPI0035DB8CF0